MLNRSIKTIALICVALALRTQAIAQEANSPPPILKGGIVHQLRSLSEDAFETLRKAERNAYPTEHQRSNGSAANPRNPAQTAPPQPTGRSTLRRTNESPWLERFPAGSSSPDEFIDNLHPSRQPRLMDQRDKWPARVVTAEQLRQRSGDTEPSLELPMLEPEFYGEVHVEEDVLDTVRHSLRDETEASYRSNSRYDQRNGIDASTSPASNAMADDGEDSQELFPRGREGNASEKPAGPELRAPLVPRIPLPSTSSTTRPKPAKTNPPAESTAKPATPARESSPSAVSPTLPAPLNNDLGAAATRNAKDVGAVSVPTLMVATPSTERQPTLPELPRITPRAGVQSAPAATGSETLAPQTLALPTLPTNLPPSMSAETAKEGERPAPPAANPNIAGDMQRMRMETPRIEVVLNGPADMPVGTPATFEVLVSNRDNFDLEGLILRLDVPAGVSANSKAPSHGEVEVEQAENGDTLFTWSFQKLEAGKSATAPIEMVASQSRNFGVAMEWTLMPLNAETEIAVRTPRIEMLLEGPAEVNYGEANTYRLHVRNVGNAPATAVAVKLSAGPYGASSADIGSIRAGGEETIDVELTFNQKGSVGISASAAASGNLKCDTKIDVLVKQPNIVATIEAATMVYFGNPVDYRVKVSNTGDADARDLTTLCSLPTGATLDKIPDGAALRDGKLTWPIALLRAGTAEEVSLQLNLANEGENRLQMKCSNANGLATECVANTRVEAIVDLKLTVNDPIAPAPIGTDVPYELTLTNRGSKAGNNVKVVAQFSDGIEPIRGEGHAFRLVPGQLLFDPIPRIEAGESITLKVFARAEVQGTHRFRTEVRSDDSELKLAQEESTQYLKAPSRIATPPAAAILR